MKVRDESISFELRISCHMDTEGRWEGSPGDDVALCVHTNLSRHELKGLGPDKFVIHGIGDAFQGLLYGLMRKTDKGIFILDSQQMKDTFLSPEELIEKMPQIKKGFVQILSEEQK